MTPRYPPQLRITTAYPVQLCTAHPIETTATALAYGIFKDIKKDQRALEGDVDLLVAPSPHSAKAARARAPSAESLLPDAELPDEITVAAVCPGGRNACPWC